ncbi:MAG TPA: hypothetical protein VG714_05395 [Acidobacteriaceae bacterium]|nr:hypothetical protein [Acidobacteriaceae bacterium]
MGDPRNLPFAVCDPSRDLSRASRGYFYWTLFVEEMIIHKTRTGALTAALCYSKEKRNHVLPHGIALKESEFAQAAGVAGHARAASGTFQ